MDLILRESGCIIVASAGNDDGAPVYHPAAHPGVIAVGSIQLQGIPEREYHVFAWVDVQAGTNTLEPGDYFNQSLPVHFKDGASYEVLGTVFQLDADLKPAGTPLLQVQRND